LLDFDGRITEMLYLYECRNRIVTIELGYDGVDEADYQTIFKGNISGISYKAGADGTIYTFSCGDLRRTLKKSVFTTATDDAPVTFTSQNPIDILLYVLTDTGTNGLSIAAASVNSTSIEELRDTWFSGVRFAFDIREPEDGKAFLEEQICLPLGLYLIVEGDGRLNLKRVGSPLYIERGTLTITDADITRVPTIDYGVRDLVNEVRWSYDYDADANEYDTESIYVDSTSLTVFEQSKTITIEARGVTSAQNGFIERRNSRIFARFANPYPRYKVSLKMALNQLEEGSLIDFSCSKIPNLLTGKRSIDTPILCEVVSVDVDVTRGAVNVELIDTPWNYSRTVVVSDLAIEASAATEQQKKTYGWIGRTSDNKIISGTEDGYVVQEG